MGPLFDSVSSPLKRIELYTKKLLIYKGDILISESKIQKLIKLHRTESRVYLLYEDAKARVCEIHEEQVDVFLDRTS